jgi:hypothetical protein
MVDSAMLFWGHARRTGEDSEPTNPNYTYHMKYLRLQGGNIFVILIIYNISNAQRYDKFNL